MIENLSFVGGSILLILFLRKLKFSKFYIKNKRFAHQNEFRFTWKLPNEINKPIIMDFPEAIKFCKKK